MPISRVSPDQEITKRPIPRGKSRSSVQSASPARPRAASASAVRGLCRSDPALDPAARRRGDPGQPFQSQARLSPDDDRSKGGEVEIPPALPPGFNPIEMAFSKLKALLRKATERTVAGLWEAIGRFVDVFTPQECVNYFVAAGYDAD